MTQYMVTSPRKVTLETPGGRKWEVKIKKKDNKVWLRRGWPEFATCLKLEPGSFLVFNYHEGKHAFLVEVFDSSTWEIQYPSVTNASNEFAHEPALKRPEVVEIMDEENDEFAHEPMLKRPEVVEIMDDENDEDGVGPTMSTEVVEIMDDENDEDEDDVGPTMSTEGFITVKRTAPCSSNYKNRASNSYSRYNAHHGTIRLVRRPSYGERAFQFVVQGWKLSTMEIKRVFGSTRFRGPNVVVLMHRCFVRPPYEIGLPTKFVKRYFNLANENIMLKDDEGAKTWSGVYSITKHSNTKIKGGWKALAIYKWLRVRDICVFELLEGLENSLKIHIFRAVEGG